MSHEAAHVATRRGLQPLPVWLAEGFADYVALRDVDAAAVHDRQPDHPPGAPRGPARERSRTTPTSTPGAEHLGAAYEAPGSPAGCWPSGSARSGAGPLLPEADGSGDDFTRLFRRAFGSRERASPQQWRSALTDLAA